MEMQTQGKYVAINKKPKHVQISIQTSNFKTNF